MTLQSMQAREFQSAFSLYKQADAETALTASNINKALPYRGLAPGGIDFPQAISDEGWYGKGDDKPTFWDPIQKAWTIPQREFSATDLSALFAFAFVMGLDTAAQPNSAAAPTVYDHVLTFQDTESAVECKYTTLLEKFGDRWEDLVHGAVISQASLVGGPNDHVLLRYQGVARDREASVQAMPNLTTTGGFFNFRRSTITFGSQAAPTDVSSAITNFEFTAMQNPRIRRNAGASAGDELKFDRALVGRQRVNGSITMDKVDSDLRNLFLNNTLCSIEILCAGAIISGAYRYQIKIEVPNYYLPNFNTSEEEDLATFQLPFNEQTVIKSGSDPYARVTIRTTIDDSAILETEP